MRRPSTEPAEPTLLGLVQHRAEVERACFQRAFAGHDGRAGILRERIDRTTGA
ncbi:hypothetical protein ABT330_34225 [Streptomyces sp. NPDC000658]|uniref:hypothetical protein n=1 Tax=Streptomyces sp. NPDC000658 TaxID=3154266 RepID=UPI00331E90FF